jgi:hypothetical protein
LALVTRLHIGKILSLSGCPKSTSFSTGILWLAQMHNGEEKDLEGLFLAVAP